MIQKNVIFESLYFLGASLLLLTGIVLKLAAPLGVGIYLLYSGPGRISLRKNADENILFDQKLNLIWNILFLGLSTILSFSIIKVIFNIFRGAQPVSPDQIIIYIYILGVLFFEFLYRISLKKKNRFVAILIVIILILSVGAFILGGHWLKTDLMLGFLSLTVTVIISFRKAYLGLTDFLS